MGLHRARLGLEPRGRAAAIRAWVPGEAYKDRRNRDDAAGERAFGEGEVPDRLAVEPPGVERGGGTSDAEVGVRAWGDVRGVQDQRRPVQRVTGVTDGGSRYDAVGAVVRRDRHMNHDVEVAIARVPGQGVDDRQLIFDWRGVALTDQHIPRRRSEGLDVEVVVGDVLAVGAEAVRHEWALVEVDRMVRGREVIGSGADLEMTGRGAES